ncbi:hypothetical protein ACW5WN_11165, partial [Aeromonas lacus]
VCNLGHFWMIHNYLCWIARGHPFLSPYSSPAGKGHIDHPLLYLNIDGEAEALGKGHHAAVAWHGHA